MNVTLGASSYPNDFEILLYVCFDSLNCKTCSYDVVNLNLGSKICTECYTGKGVQLVNSECVYNCGDGLVFGPEMCDDNGNNGCK
jgi:hypothetical protein